VKCAVELPPAAFPKYEIFMLGAVVGAITEMNPADPATWTRPEESTATDCAMVPLG